MRKLIKKIFKKIYNVISQNSTATNLIKNTIDGTNLIGNIDLVKIGSSVSFGGNVTLFANALIEIGDHTMIAINATLHTSTHDYNKHPMWLERIDKPIKIGKHVWIGTGAIILPGVIVGDYAVVGAGSVVTSNIPSLAVVAGNPARILKYRNLNNELFSGRMNHYPEGSFITKGKHNDVLNECKKK